MHIGVKELYAILVVVDRLTSLCFVAYTGRKTRKAVSPKLKEALDFFAKRLVTSKASLIMFMDAGKEFDPQIFKDAKMDYHIVAAGSKVEKKNSDIQRQFHRLKNAKRLTSIKDGLAQATKIVNASYNRVIKMSADEAAEKYSSKEETQKLILEYNKHREKADEDRRRPLKEGDMVRLVMKSTKASPFYKAYRGKQYTQDGYPVNEKNKQFYKNRSITKEAYKVTEIKGKNPRKYKVDGKWHSRDRLSEPLPPIEIKDKDGKITSIVYSDPKSEALLRERDKKPKKKVEASPMETGPAPAKSTKAKKKVEQAKMVPSDKAVTHAFKDTAEAETEYTKVRERVRWYLKRSRKPSEKKLNAYEERLEKLRAWYEWHVDYGPPLFRTSFKNFLDQITSLQTDIDDLGKLK